MECLLAVPDRPGNVTINLEPVRFPVFLRSSLYNRHQLMLGYSGLKNHHWKSTGIMFHWRTIFDSSCFRGVISKPYFRKQDRRIGCLESGDDPIALRVYLNGFRVNRKLWFEKNVLRLTPIAPFSS